MEIHVISLGVGFTVAYLTAVLEGWTGIFLTVSE